VLLPLLLAGVFGVWLRFAWVLRGIAALPNLARDPVRPEPDGGGGWPRLSVVLAARDEATSIRGAVSSLLAQDYPALEVVAVDDRSGDATGAILDELVAAHPALKVVHVDALPDGWLGKTNALARGAAEATGELLLFTDADVLFADGALRRAVAWAGRERLGHAVAFPHFVAPGLLERSFVSLFGLFVFVHLEANTLGRPGSAAHVGVGAFNLVRRDAYQMIGGHSRLRLEVADDVKLGLILRRSGVRQRCADSGGLVRVRWQRGFVASMVGLIKNFFAGCEFRWRVALRHVVLVPMATTFPAVCLALSSDSLTRVVAAAATALSVALHGATARRIAGGRGHEGLLLPIVGLCIAGVSLVSAVVTTVRGAVIWRGTRYPLRDLDAACVREADWPRDRAV
jgi:glycosyltransferase involved in cell wall biosynthesis